MSEPLIDDLIHSSLQQSPELHVHMLAQACIRRDQRIAELERLIHPLMRIEGTPKSFTVEPVSGKMEIVCVSREYLMRLEEYFNNVEGREFGNRNRSTSGFNGIARSCEQRIDELRAMWDSPLKPDMVAVDRILLALALGRADYDVSTYDGQDDVPPEIVEYRALRNAHELSKSPSRMIDPELYGGPVQAGGVAP